MAEALQEVADLTEDDPLVHPEQVDGAEDDHQHRDRGGPRRVGERAQEDHELAHEAGQARQAHAGHHEEAEHRGVDRGPCGQAAHLRDRPVVGALVDDAHAEEQGAGDDAVVDHLHDRALHALLVEHEDAQRHEAHVAHRRVGDQLLEVRLDDGHDRAVDDRDEAQHDDQRTPLVGRVGEERQREADEAVAAELEQHAGEDHGARGGRLHVRVRQPRVEREHRDLDGERQEERAERRATRRCRRTARCLALSVSTEKAPSQLPVAW